MDEGMKTAFQEASEVKETPSRILARELYTLSLIKTCLGFESMLKDTRDRNKKSKNMDSMFYASYSPSPSNFEHRMMMAMPEFYVEKEIKGYDILRVRLYGFLEYTHSWHWDTVDMRWVDTFAKKSNCQGREFMIPAVLNKPLEASVIENQKQLMEEVNTESGTMIRKKII